ncbi:MAG: hypothetical protein A2041_00585 [Bacteroidetes bacterium GWA2_31_9b]|nr:MAG: hypothetical protein A2041_00585 [Bacteroidetes bacterium GWA2_31_9b]
MKTLKIIGIIIIVLIVIFLLLGIIMPKAYHVERSASINAPVGIVFDQVKYFKNSSTWAPWNAYDTNMVTTIEGEDGTVGAISRWKGNKNVGSGSQEIVTIEENKRIDFKMIFLEPFESESMAYFDLIQENNTVNITWGFDGVNKFPWNALSIFMDMDKMLGADFEKGLNDLKVKCEGINAQIEKYGFQISEFNFEGKAYLAKKKSLKFDEMHNFFATNYAAIGQLIKEKGIEMDGYPVGLYYSWDMEKMISELAVAMPVKGITESPSPDFELITLGKNKALKIKFYGDYEKIGDAHMAMDAYMKDNNLKQLVPVIEIYVTDPMTEPDTSKWLTKLIYFVE